MSELFGTYLRTRRRELDASQGGYSIRQLALRLRVHHSFLSRIERGEPARLSERKLLALARELGEDPDLILAMNGMVAEDVRRAILKRPTLFSRLVRELRDAPDEDVRSDPELRRERSLLTQRISDKAVRLRRALDELRLFRQAVDDGPAAVCIVKSGRITYVNQAFLQLWGFASLGDILGRHRDELWVEPVCASEYFRQMEQSGLAVIENLARRADGTTFLARVSVSPVRDLTGLVTGFIAGIVDVTRERALERGLASSNQWLRQFVEDMQDVLLLLDERGRVIYVTPSLEDFWGHDIQKVQGRSLVAFALPEHQPMLRSQIEQTLQGAHTVGEHRMLHGNGAHLWARLSLCPRRDGQGRVTGVQGVAYSLVGWPPRDGKPGPDRG